MIQLSKPSRNKPGIYKGDLTAGSLKLPESRIVADLLLRNVGPEDWKQAIYLENVLQSKTSETSRRLANLIRRRLQTMEPPLWKLVRDGKGHVAMHAALAATVKQSQLLGDFLQFVVEKTPGPSLSFFTFGKVPITAIAKLTRVVEGEPQPIGRQDAEEIKKSLVEQKMLDTEGRLLPAFDPKKSDFKIQLPQRFQELIPTVVDLLASYQIERHIRKDKDEGVNRLKKEVLLSPEFQALWDRIKPKTTYRVEFETDELVRRAVAAIKKMETIEAAKIRVTAGQIGVVRGGVTTTGISVAEEQTTYRNRPVPDILAYLQNETELTRSTLVRILKESDRLAEFFADPQRFMDAIADILKHELHRLLVDGIKYEKIDGGGPETEWEMLLFKNEELVNYLNALAVNHSLYEYVVYESEVEKVFAKKLDQREDIRLFVKLPGWFEIDTPVGKYNPDWAIIKHDDQTLYFVRETKSTKDFMKLRTSEADKIRCGQKHFETLGASFSVVVSADEV